MDGQHYQSDICDANCGHRHRTWEAAERCARRRIAAGELRYYMGQDQPLRVPAEALASYVRRYHDCGMRVGG